MLKNPSPEQLNDFPDLPIISDVLDIKLANGCVLGMIKIRAELVLVPHSEATKVQIARAVSELLDYMKDKCSTANIGEILAFVQDERFAEILENRGFSKIDGIALGIQSGKSRGEESQSAA